MVKKASAFVPSPGSNQNRKLVPVNGKFGKAANLAAKIANNAINSPNYTMMDLARDVSPVVNPYMSGQLGKLATTVIPQAYRMSQNSKVKSVMKEIGGSVFPGKIDQIPSGMTDYGLSKAPNPKKINLRSGIVPNAWANDGIVAVANKCLPMHITSASLQLPTGGSDFLDSYFRNNIAFAMQTRAQANVGFDILTGSNFTSQQIQTAMNATIKALQIYYWYTSILAFSADTKNKNEAMKNLRDNIGSATLNQLDILANRLESTPCPPRIVQWVKFFSSNYYSGDTQGAPIIKTCFGGTLVIFGNDAFGASTVAAATAALSSAANNTVYTLMRRAIPQWTIKKLYDVPLTPIFSPQFLTVFSNLPATYYTTSAQYVNTVADTNTPISYNSYSNKLDGIAFGLCSAWNSSTSSHQPGLVAADAATMGVTSAGGTTRVSWSSTGWITSNATFPSQSRQDTYTFDGTAVATPHLYGSDKLQNVNINALNQTCSNVLDFLFDTNSIPAKGMLNSFNRKANGSI